MTKNIYLKNYAKKAQLIQPNTASNSPFDTLKYNKVIAYDFEGSEEPHSDAVKRYGYKRYAPVILRQKSLNQKQVNFTTNFLTDIQTYGGVHYACFEPHFGLVFYQDNEIQCSVSVCLDCNFLRSSVTIPVTETKIDGEYISFGFSEQGKQNIIKLCKQLGFDYGKL